MVPPGQGQGCSGRPGNESGFVCTSATTSYQHTQISYKQILNAREDLLDGDPCPPILVFVQNTQADLDRHAAHFKGHKRNGRPNKTADRSRRIHIRMKQHRVEDTFGRLVWVILRKGHR
jgi:hypothetical protein